MNRLRRIIDLKAFSKYFSNYISFRKLQITNIKKSVSKFEKITKTKMDKTYSNLMFRYFKVNIPLSIVKEDLKTAIEILQLIEDLVVISIYTNLFDVKRFVYLHRSLIWYIFYAQSKTIKQYQEYFSKMQMAIMLEEIKKRELEKREIEKKRNIKSVGAIILVLLLIIVRILLYKNE